MRHRFLVITLLLLLLGTWGAKASNTKADSLYTVLQRNLAQGWNTWDVRSVLTHVYMPYAFAIDINLVDSQGKRVNHFLIGDRGNNAPRLKPYSHTYDGYYTKISVSWYGHHFMIETAAEGSNNMILITPEKKQ